MRRQQARQHCIIYTPSGTGGIPICFLLDLIPSRWGFGGCHRSSFRQQRHVSSIHHIAFSGPPALSAILAFGGATTRFRNVSSSLLTPTLITNAATSHHQPCPSFFIPLTAISFF
ncbi:uncharacterized protein TrAFT101_010300 [Trichoderma asperellum]|uniref:uncharacterized protein n=1 Tax=Trichoderma asperellum TaxID=101201 RepID=UPI0033337BD3|nr:hypothetical protein TrAFT101_010300 [Trichoderma asperellum]